MTDEPSIDLPDGWRPEWGPPKRRLKKEENKRIKAEASASVFGEVIPPRTRKKGDKTRPFDDALKGELVQRIASGELLISILRDEGMPPRWAVYEHMSKDQQFASDMKVARKVAASVFADEILEIADNAAEDYRADGSINYEVIARSKLKTDSRKWLMERIDPESWGSKGQVDITSGGEKLEAKEINPLESARQVAFAIELAKRAKEENEP